MKETTLEFVNEMIDNTNLNIIEQKVAKSIVQQLNLPSIKKKHASINLDALPIVSNKRNKNWVNKKKIF